MSPILETLAKAARDPRVAARTAAAEVAAARSAAEGARDARRLHREHPRLVPDGCDQQALRAVYDRYTADVSAPDMAMSCATAIYLCHLCAAASPKRVLDLGSGFSSYVFRQHAALAAEDVAVVSVDDSEPWLERTREFLTGQGLDTAELQAWGEFSTAPGEPFDVIFHDLASGQLREDAMRIAVRALAPRGLIVFDDAQHPGHRRAARAVAGEAGLATYSLHRWTIDAYGRFAMLAAP